MKGKKSGRFCRTGQTLAGIGGKYSKLGGELYLADIFIIVSARKILTVFFKLSGIFSVFDQTQRIPGAAVEMYLEMKMGTGGLARSSHRRHGLASQHCLTLADQHF